MYSVLVEMVTKKGNDGDRHYLPLLSSLIIHSPTAIVSLGDQKSLTEVDIVHKAKEHLYTIIYDDSAVPLHTSSRHYIATGQCLLLSFMCN